MRRSLPVAVCLILLVPALGTEVEAKEAKSDDAAFQARVDKAIVKGARWLEKQGTGKADFGHSALVALTLAHCGRGLGDRKFHKLFESVIEKAEETLRGRVRTGGHATYSLSIVAMLVHELYGGPHADPPERERTTPSPANPLGLPARLRVLVNRLASWFAKARLSDGLWTYGLRGLGTGAQRLPHGGGFGGDLSNSQYAILGLWASARCGASVDTAWIRGLAEVLLRCQQAEGKKVARRADPSAGRTRPAYRKMDEARGFGYGVVMPRPHGMVVSPGCTGSMTAGGLSSLLILKSLLLENDEDAGESPLVARLDQAVWDAIAWLTINFAVDRNPMPAGFGFQAPPPGVPTPPAIALAEAPWHGYYLYGLERAMVVAGKRYLGDHDWYREGAEILLEAQHKDGSWSRGTKKAPKKRAAKRGTMPGFTPITDTCFALLFLKRATLRPRRPLLRTEVTPSEKDPPRSSGKER